MSEQSLTGAAILAAAPSILGQVAASSFQVPVADYLFATELSVIGIIARHCYDASKAGQLNIKALAFDLPTAPMLGIVAYIGCQYFEIAPMITPGIVILLSFLGPEWVRSLGSGLADVVLSRIRGKQP